MFVCEWWQGVSTLEVTHAALSQLYEEQRTLLADADKEKLPTQLMGNDDYRLKYRALKKQVKQRGTRSDKDPQVGA